MEISAIELYDKLKECKTELEKVRLILKGLEDAYNSGFDNCVYLTKEEMDSRYY